MKVIIEGHSVILETTVIEVWPATLPDGGDILEEYVPLPIVTLLVSMSYSMGR